MRAMGSGILKKRKCFLVFCLYKTVLYGHKWLIASEVGPMESGIDLIIPVEGSLVASGFNYFFFRKKIKKNIFS